jgi:hypothetical protein
LWRAGVEVSFVCGHNGQRPVETRNGLEGGQTVKSQNPTTNGQNLSRGIHRPDLPEGKGKNVPTLDEIHRRALEIHVERGGQGCDLDDYLDDWRQAERELREKYNRSNDEGAKKK